MTEPRKTDAFQIGREEMDAIRAEAMDFAGIGLYRYRFDGTVLFMDRGAMRILDIEGQFPDPAAVAGKNISDLLVYVGPKGLLRQKISEHRHLRNYPYPFKTLTGKEGWALHDTYLVKDPATGEDVIQVIIKDITELRKVEEQLAAEKEMLAVTLRSIGDAVIAARDDGTIILLNRAAEKLTGWPQEDAAGKPLKEIFRIIDEDTREPLKDPLAEVLERGMAVSLSGQALLVARDGSERLIADSGAPIFDRQSKIIGVVLAFRDITQERRLEQEQRRTEALESLGLLAGGIAHDFNNFLTGILGNISLARMYARASQEEEISGLLDEAEKASLKARTLTQQLLTFARGGTPVKLLVSLGNLLEESVGFVLRGSAVKAEFDLEEGLWDVEVDPDQISEVIHNITLNAKQAMPEGGSLNITARNCSAEAEPLIPSDSGRYVRMSFGDTGIGMPRKHLAHMFEPYFTTKQEGTGLGLATAYSIVRRHGGHIFVESRLGVGTTFTVYLPASERRGARLDEKSGATVAGEGRVLLVDDQEFVLGVAARMLKALGYEVECVKDGQEAVDAYARARTSDHPYAIVVMDLTIPGGMGGVRALERLRELDPEVKAVVSSGYSNDPVLSNYTAYGFKGVVRKPYNMEDLSQILDRVLHPPARE